MKILMLGARGYIGAVAAERLEAGGHEVVELDRPGADEGPRAARTGDLTDPDSLTEAVTADIDAVVNLATPTGDGLVDTAAMAALAAPLRGTGRALVYTSGVWVLGATKEAVDERAPVNPIPIVGYRPAIEYQVIEEARHQVRSMVVRPGIVHGRGGGIPAMMVDLAREHGAGLVVGSADTRWPMVHVEDLADLYAAALDQAVAGTVWHGVSEQAVPVAGLARAAGRAARANGPVRTWQIDQARAALGEAFADALALDQVVSGEAAQTQLGWRPRRVGAVQDLLTEAGVEFYGGNPEDVAAVLHLVAELEHAQQHELPAEFMRLFSKNDPVWTTARGRRLSGWDEISAFTHQVLPGAMAESTARYDVARIMFIRPDVAVVNAHQVPVALDGAEFDGRPQGRPCYMLSKDEGEWRIAAAQNTQVAP